MTKAAPSSPDLGPVDWNAEPDVDFDIGVPPPPETTYTLEAPTVQECYLAAILLDRSGLDLAEFTWVEERNKPDYCWRAWPFQWAWWRCMDQKQIDLAGRALGKSESIKARCCVFAFAHPGGEMVITAPEGIHVEAITERIEAQFTATRFMREMLFRGRNGITHRPFKVRFVNGARIMSRIPQRTGAGVKGCFPAGTLILTRRGQVPIEDVKIGDVVFTHRRRWRRVLATHRYVDQVTRVSIDGHPGITATAAHPLWAKVATTEDELDVSPAWVRIEDIGELEVTGGVWVASPASFPTVGRSEVDDEEAFERGVLAAGVGRIPDHTFEETRPNRAAFLTGLEAAGVEGDEAFCVDVATLAHQLAKPARVDRVRSPLASRLAARFGGRPAAESWKVTFGAGSEEFEAGQLYQRVTKVETVRGTVPVFDLTVEDDHSYIANGLTVSNTHPVWLEMDEGQDYPEKGWKEIRETLQRDTEGSQWRVHGVTRGIPDDFYNATQPDSGWTVHFPITAMHKPTWTELEKTQKLQEYSGGGDGSVDDPDYRRNVLGVHGDTTSSIFDLSKLMYCVDQRLGSFYNESEFEYQEIRFEQVADRARAEGVGIDEYGRILCDLLELPEIHRQSYKTFWGGMDVGITKDPSEIVIFAEYAPTAKERTERKNAGIAVPPEGQTCMKLLYRLKLLRMDTHIQASAVVRLLEHYKPVAFGMDKTGNGTGIFQDIQKEAAASRFVRVQFDLDEDEAGTKEGKARAKEKAKSALVTIKGYNFGEKIVVEIDESKAAQLPKTASIEEIVKAAGITKQVKTHATDQCRLLVGGHRVLLPYQRDLILQLTGQTWQYANSATDAYGDRAKRYSEGVFHAFDAVRMAVLAMVMRPVEDVLFAPVPKKRPVLDYPVFGV